MQTSLDALPWLEPRLVLRGATVITRDVVGRICADVLVEDGRIIDLLPPQTSLPGAAELDCTGRFLHPGLVDAHCHLPDDGADAMLLLHGITTVRDMWGSPFSLRWRDDARTRRRPGPRVVAASPLLEQPLRDSPRYPGQIAVGTPAQARAQARLYAAAGYDQLKVYSALDEETLRAICSATDLTVTGHCPTGLTWEQALDCGMRIFEHAVEVQAGHLSGDAGVARPARPLLERVAEWDDERDLDALRHLGDRLVAAGAAVTPTLVVWGRLDRAADEVEPEHLRHVPDVARKRWTRGRLSGDVRAAVTRQQELVAESVRVLAEQGVPLLVGTDAGSLWTVAGFSYAEELSLLQDAGVPDVLELASSGAADVLGLPSGRLRPGADADVLVLDGDPDLDPLAATRPALVLTGGRIASRETLLAAVEIRARDVDRLAGATAEHAGPMATAEWWAR